MKEQQPQPKWKQLGFPSLQHYAARCRHNKSKKRALNARQAELQNKSRLTKAEKDELQSLPGELAQLEKSLFCHSNSQHGKKQVQKREPLSVYLSNLQKKKKKKKKSKRGRKPSKWVHFDASLLIAFKEQMGSERAASEALGCSVASFRTWTGAGNGKKTPKPPENSRQLEIKRIITAWRQKQKPTMSERETVARKLIAWAAQEKNPMPFMEAAAALLNEKLTLSRKTRNV